MALFCLTPQLAEKFKQGIVDGSISPEKLNKMTSKERHAFFSDLLGETNAAHVNSLFESKLLLKNQQAGMINWAKRVLKDNPSLSKDIITKIERLNKVLDPKDQQSFLEDLATSKLGTNVTFEEAQKITELSQKVQTEKANNPHSIEYGRAALNLQDYVEGLKPSTKNLAANLANIPKTAMTTLDFSAALRQGWGMIGTGEFYKALPRMFQYAFSKNKYRDLQASIISDPLYDVAKKSGLRVSVLADKLSQREEAYMTTLLNKVPGISASERAYVGFLNKLRFERFKSLIKSAELSGEDVRPGSQATKDIANTVNDFTGSGNIGTGDKYASAVPALNASFFSPRKISATINMFNPKRYLDPKISPTARKAALRQLIGSVGVTMGVLAIAKLAGSKVETDSNSSNFGKVVIGKTHYEVTGGNSSYAVLISRLLSGKTKSSVSGKVTKLNAKDKKGKPVFGGNTKGDLAVDFARNKLSPNASLIVDWLYGSDAVGKPFKLTTELKNRITPLIIQDINSLNKEDKGNLFPGVMADLFGVGTQTY